MRSHFTYIYLSLHQFTNGTKALKVIRTTNGRCADKRVTVLSIMLWTMWSSVTVRHGQLRVA